MLNHLAIKYGTDKSSKHHGYADIYETYLSPLKDAEISLLEIGIGGYDFPNKGGNSLRMWREYFTKARIVGIDIYKKDFTIPGVEMYFDGEAPAGNWDVIIDDGSHVNEDVINTFVKMWPSLNAGGLYVVEDVHTSYYEENYGGCWDPEAIHTTMAYFLRLCHQLNHETLDARWRTEHSGQIEYIHFYKQLIVIKKKA